MDIDVSKEEWLEWKGNKVTKAFLKILFNKREYLKEGLANNSHSSENDRLIDVGQCIGIADNINYAIEGFEYLEKGSEENGTESIGV